MCIDGGLSLYEIKKECETTPYYKCHKIRCNETITT